MKKKRKLKISAEQWARWTETQRKLAERIAYHEAKLAEERAARES